MLRLYQYGVWLSQAVWLWLLDKVVSVRMWSRIWYHYQVPDSINPWTFVDLSYIEINSKQMLIINKNGTNKILCKNLTLNNQVTKVSMFYLDFKRREHAIIFYQLQNIVFIRNWGTYEESDTLSCPEHVLYGYLAHIKEPMQHSGQVNSSNLVLRFMCMTARDRLMGPFNDDLCCPPFAFLTD